MSDRPRRGALSVSMDDVEHPLEPFWRGVIAYRLLTLLTVVGVTLYHLRTAYERPLAAVGVLVVMAVWTAVTSWGYLGGLPGAPDRRGLLALADLGVCVAIMRAPMVIRWPGVIRPGTVKNQIFASLDWLPTFVEIAGGPKGNALKSQIESGQYPGIVKTTLDGVNQIEYLSGRSEKSARDTFFYYSGKDPSAVRYKNWKMYFAMVSQSPTGFTAGVQPYHWTQVVNIKRDPFEASIGSMTKTMFGMGGAISSPSTAYVYDWNMLPIGQALWLKELETYIPFPPLQNPASYNLEQVMQQVRDMKNTSHAGE